MKFRIKITLIMVCMLSILLAIGSTAMIHLSFQSALRREEEAACKSVQLLLNSIQVMEQRNPKNDETTILNTLKQITSKESFAALSLSSFSKTHYKKGRASGFLRNFSGRIDEDHLLVGYFSDDNAHTYLQVTGCFVFQGEELYLNIGFDLTPIFETRIMQQASYRRIFIGTLLLCGLLVYIAAWLLTRPLEKLTKAIRRFADGDLLSRSMVHTNDEIGLLSEEYDHMAERIQKNIQDLKEAAIRQEEFMGSFTHELKTPMTSIIGYADLLRGGNLTPAETADAAEYIFSEGMRLEHLSLTLLDIFVADNQDISFAETSPALLIRDITEHLKPIYQSEGIILTCRCEEGTCLLHEDLIRTLLLNLLENARKAMPEGGSISIQSNLTDEGCMISIEDNGYGIPKEAIRYLTEAFYRVDKARSRKHGNAGLGLTLCDKIARLHHGELRFESELNTGTRVTVLLKGGRP